MHHDTAPAATGSVTLPDGRTLAYAEYGDPDGTPVLFLPGAASGRRMSFGGPLPHRRGIRLISIDRPGLGASTPDPAKTLRSVGADLAHLARTAAGGPAPLVANSQGAPFALAAALAGAATRLVLASPADEAAHPALRPLLPDHFQNLLANVAADPEQAARAFADYTADGLFDMVLGSHPPCDAPVYTDPAFRRMFRAALDEGIAGGPSGYPADTVLAMSPWNLDLDRITVPVSIHYGAHDHAHSPDRCRTLASRIPTARLHTHPDAGGSLLWARPEPILDAALHTGD
ncbi:alpha/beta fold hydrolase [Nocardiopsis potens]|uniref:alpha/beta fold hydrolase n=1 Tax=Nocardiopsis potens TaxID=1246458 RepID=UPI00036B3555|nr:alpha/beta hydrolase [Nocardiopsis potens]